MFNLLPNIFKEEIKSEYKLRKWIVFLCFILFLQISFLILAGSLWLISSVKESEIVSQIKKENENLSSENTNDILKVIDSTNKKLAIFNSVMKYPEILPIYNTITSNKTSDIKLMEFSYATDVKETDVVIKGISSTREALVSFEKKLEESNAFSSVDLPVSNLAKQKNLDFTLTIVIKNK